jgi:hypothetical protein
LISPEQVWGGDAKITDVVVKKTGESILLDFRVEGCFTEDLEQAILNGIPTTFKFLAALDRIRSWWTDKELISLETTHTVKYNKLKDEFVITRGERAEYPLVVNSLSEAEEMMASVQNLKIAELEILEKDRRYQVKIKAELSKITLPFYLHYVFRFFLFLWDFETDWYTLDFMY